MNKLHASGIDQANGGRALSGLLVAIVLLAACVTQFFAPTLAVAAPPVDLGTAITYGVLGGSTVTNTGPTVINGNAGGDLGVWPGSSITGFPPGTVAGAIHAGDAAAQQAQTDLTAGYLQAAGLPTTLDLTGVDLGGLTLTPGVYNFSSSAQLTGELTLDAEGDPDAAFVFKIGSTLTTASNSRVTLINGARYCRTFWQVGSSATLGTDTDFVGHVMALASITANTGADVQGQLLARTGAVTLDDNQITNGICAAAPTVSVTKTLAPGQAETVGVGDSVAYRIQVTNSGETTLTTVPLDDTFDSAHLSFVSASTDPDSALGDSLTWDDVTGTGELGPDETITITVNFTATAAGTAVENTSTVTGATDMYGLIAPTVSATDSTLAISAPTVSVTKALAPGQDTTVRVGDPVAYRIQVTNSGDSTLAVVPMEDTFDSTYLDFVSASPTPDHVLSNSLTWDDLTGTGELGPDETITITVNFTATAVGSLIENTATVEGATDIYDVIAPEVSATDTTLVISSLTVTKTADPPSGTIVAPGQTIEYQINYANNGPSVLPDVALQDALPAAVTYVPGSLVLNGVPIPDTGNYDPDTRTIDVAVGDVAPQGSGQLTFEVTVGALSVSRYGIRNVGSWTTSDSTEVLTAPIYHYVAPLDIAKSVTNTSGTVIRTGSILRWRIVVTNRGIVPATNVVVTDVIPAFTTYVRNSMTGPGDVVVDARHLRWNIGTIGVGHSVTLTFKSSVNLSAPDRTVIANHAWVSAVQSPLEVSNTVRGTVRDTSTIVVRTSGNEGITIGLMALFGAMSLGFAWRGRPGGPRRGMRLARATTTLLIGALLVLGGLEVGASLGLPMPSPGEYIATHVSAVSSGIGTRTTTASSSGAVSGRVVIPAIGVIAALVEGTSMRVLSKGVWHQPPSVRPGTKGASVIAGHRVSRQFSRLRQLHAGDRVRVTVGGKTYQYRVATVSTRNAASARIAFRTGATEKLILYTCLPRWQGNKRTIVVCYPTAR